MTIKEMEAQAGMDRANIRFYEREGFISPKRLDNGYRDYSEEDLKILLRVKLLRSLHIPLDEIRALKDGSRDLAATLSGQLAKLEQEKRATAYAQEVCRAIREDRVTFSSLDARLYLDGIRRETEASGSGYFSIAADALPQVFYPWRRFLARTLDYSLYNMLWTALLAFLFRVNLSSRSAFGDLFDLFFVTGLLLLLEPLWLHRFGTTPGKALFGLRIEAPGGRRLSYREALARTWSVVGLGMGYNIPIYNLVRLWKSYKLCSENETQPWDEDCSYTIRDTKSWRSVLFVAAYAALFAVGLTIVASQQLPPHRGSLTIAEFAENHNFYADLLGVDLGGRLDENAGWMTVDEGGATVNVGGYTERPEFVFTLENGYVTSVSFAVELRNSENWLGSYDTQMVLASLAFAGARREVGLFSKTPERIAKQITDSAFEDFSFTEAGVSIACDTEYSGYDPVPPYYLLPQDGASETYFKLSFLISQ